MAARYPGSGQGTGPWQGRPAAAAAGSMSGVMVKISEASGRPAVTSSPEAMYPLYEVSLT